MGYRVTSEVFDRSRQKGGKLLILLAVAETAHNEDGVAFGLDQGWPKKERSERRRRETIAGKARLRWETVSRLVAELAGEADDELEVREVQQGKERTLVYRITLGIYRDLEADMERLERYGQLLDRPFSTPEELALPWSERPANLSGRNAAVPPAETSGGSGCDDLTSMPLQPDISSVTTSNDGQVVAAAPISGAREKTHGPQPSEHPSLTSSPPNGEDEVSTPAEAGADEQAGNPSVKELVRAFARTLGRWPATRQEWGGWMRAFAPLAEQGITPGELEAACEDYLRYHRRIGHLDVDVTPFGITKHWQIVSQSLERRFLGWMRWASETSWRLPEDEVDFLLDQASRAICDGDHSQIVNMAARARAAHSEPGDELLKWVDAEGWALTDDAWRDQLHVRLPRVHATELRRAATRRRHELRRDLARLRAGIALPAQEQAA